MTMGEAKRRQQLGPTGTFPEGVARPGDQGALRMAISDADSNGNIHIDFGTSVEWIAMSRDGIINFATMLLKKAGAKKVEITL